MEQTIADKYREYVRRETEVASRKVLPMRTIVELETREFPEILPRRISDIYDGNFYAPYRQPATDLTEQWFLPARSTER
jgi:hypothetical protein